MLELLPLDLLGRKRSLLGRGHLDFFLLDLLHEFGSLGSRDFLAEAEVGSLKRKHLLEMPALALATALGLHGLELGLLLGDLGLFPLIPLCLGQTLNWGRNIRCASESGHAMTAEHGLNLLAVTGDISTTEEAEHNQFHPFLPVI